MRFLRVFALGSLLYFLLTGSLLELDTPSQQQPTYKILFVQSYSPDHPCGSPQLLGTLKVLNQSSLNYQGYVVYMYTKSRYTTAEQKFMRAQYVLRWIERIQPDVIVVYDDNAFNYVVLANKRKLAKYPILFSGLNQPVENLQHEWHVLDSACKPRANITGVMEHVHSLNIITQLHKVDMFIDKIYLLYDTTATAEYAKQVLLRQWQFNDRISGLISIIPVQVHTIQDVDRFFRSLDVRPGVAVAALAQNLMDLDTGQYVSGACVLRYIAQWSQRKKVLNLCLLNLLFAKQGLCDVGYVLRFEDMGEIVGKMILQVLLEHKPVRDIPAVCYLKGVSVANLTRLRKIGINLSPLQLRAFQTLIE